MATINRIIGKFESIDDSKPCTADKPTFPQISGLLPERRRKIWLETAKDLAPRIVPLKLRHVHECIRKDLMLHRQVRPDISAEAFCSCPEEVYNNIPGITDETCLDRSTSRLHTRENLQGFKSDIPNPAPFFVYRESYYFPEF
jgi:hypothetical protein